MTKEKEFAQLIALRASVSRHLEEGLIPFWMERACDSTCGGFFTNFDEYGLSSGTPEKYLNTQCRLTWWFSHLHHKRPELTGCLELARHGVEFLAHHFWDEEHGGWYWKVGRDGTCLDDGKIVYGQSFAIYALSAYSLATGDTFAADRASETFDLLQKYCADTHHGGYYENLRRDWTPEEPGFSGGDLKSLDTHMHLMESFTVLYETTRHPLHRRKLLEVVELIARRMIDEESGCGLNQFGLDWQPRPAVAIKRTWNAERQGEAPTTPTATTSYGHNTELSWLLRRAVETAGESSVQRENIMRGLLDHAVANGVDWEYGGIYRDGLQLGAALVLEKEFWQHAEALVGFLDGYELFDDPRYLDAFGCLWNFIERNMIAPAGEWRTLLDRQGTPLDGHLGNPWKVAYHTGRALLECETRLDRLVRKPIPT